MIGFVLAAIAACVFAYFIYRKVSAPRVGRDGGSGGPVSSNPRDEDQR